MGIETLTTTAEQEWLKRWTAGPQQTRWTTMPPQIGDAAPDRTLHDHGGQPVALHDIWRDQPALLIFWRHFGCGCGLARAERLRKEHIDYVAAGATVVIVGQGTPERAAAYRATQELEPSILCDPDYGTYHAYGLRDALVPQVLFDAPREMWGHDRATGEEFQRQRRDQGRPLVDNPWLLPGEFVIDTTGTIRLAHRYQHCEDFPEPLVLLAALTTT